jgi:hypothetical protein
MTHWSLSNVVFSLQLFENFLLLFLLFISSFIALWSDSMQGVISIFLYSLGLALCPKIWSILEKALWVLRRMYVVLLQDGILCSYLSVTLDLWCHLVVGFCWFFVWMTYLLLIEGY